jgi:hypothetical protein
METPLRTANMGGTASVPEEALMRALTLVLSAGLLLASSVATTGEAQMMQHGQPGFQHPVFHHDGFRHDRFFFHDRFRRDRFSFFFGFPGFFPPAYTAYYYPPPYYCGPPYYPPCPYAPY